MWLTEEFPSNSEKTKVVEYLNWQTVEEPLWHSKRSVNGHHLNPGQNPIRPTCQQQLYHLQKLREGEVGAACYRSLAKDIKPSQIILIRISKAGHNVST